MSLTLSTYYLTYTDRTSEACISGDFAGLCTPCPGGGRCRSSTPARRPLRPRAQDLTMSQAEGICRELGAEEQQFHQQMETGWQPVADDHNEALELVVFNLRRLETLRQCPVRRRLHPTTAASTSKGIRLAPATRPASSPTRRSGSAQRSRCGTCATRYVHYLDGRFQPVRQLRPLPAQPHHLVVGRAGGVHRPRPVLRPRSGQRRRPPGQRSSDPGRHPASGLRQGRRDILLLVHGAPLPEQDRSRRQLAGHGPGPARPGSSRP